MILESEKNKCQEFLYLIEQNLKKKKQLNEAWLNGK